MFLPRLPLARSPLQSDYEKKMFQTFILLDEADDDDDPEYNFLEDLDEPDTEDFRNDRAVRITSKYCYNLSSAPSVLLLLELLIQIENFSVCCKGFARQM